MLLDDSENRGLRIERHAVLFFRIFPILHHETGVPEKFRSELKVFFAHTQEKKKRMTLGKGLAVGLSPRNS
jgi:hypothetical protein